MKKIQLFSLILVVGVLVIIWWAGAGRLILAAGPLLQGRGVLPDLVAPTLTPTPQPIESETVPVHWEGIPPNFSFPITVAVPFPHRPFDSDMLRSGQPMPGNDYKLSVTSNAFNALTSPRAIYVNHGTRSLAHDGVSWNTAYSSIQDALAVATKGDEIWVAKGIYYPDIGLGQTKGDRKASFRLLDGVALYGGFAGTEKHRNERDWVVNVTILSGDIDTNDGANSSGIVTDAVRIKGGNAYAVVTAQNVSKTARLDGFVITAGQATGKEFPLFRGGGMVVYDHSSPTIANVTFSGNIDVFGPNDGLYSPE